MAPLLLGARLLLATVFAVAGIGKLFDRSRSERGLADFGVPRRLTKQAAVGLPVIELAVAASLLPNFSARLGGFAAAGLLLVFEVAIIASLVRGRRPECHCFGQVHLAPIGWSTIARNGLLLAVALGVALESNRYPFQWQSFSVAAGNWPILVLVVLVIVTLGQTWFILNLTSQNGRILLRLEVLEGSSARAIEVTESSQPQRFGVGLPVGSLAPRFELPGVYGETHTLEALRAAGLPVMLVFADPNCGPCSELMPEIASWQRQYASAVTIAVITRGNSDAVRAKARDWGIRTVLVQARREVAEQYRCLGTPSAVVVDAGGSIGTPVQSGSEAIRGLLNWLRLADGRNGPTRPETSQARLEAPAPVSAQHASNTSGSTPLVGLVDLDGRRLRSSDLHGHPTLVLFWSPVCGFCQRMLDSLKAWERNRSADAPQLLVVSSGSEDAVRAHGLTSRVVIDPGGNAMKAFHANGTPSGVLLDAGGRVAAQVAVGADAVFQLLKFVPSTAIRLSPEMAD